MKNPSTQHPQLAVSCQHTRLAESSVAAIDQCSCGMMQLHLGALTVRLAPCAALELLATLHDAMTRSNVGQTSADTPFSNCGSGPRGQA
jgi:hypothetical protein